MNLHAKLQQRAVAGKPVRVGLIGAGKFGSMYLAQVPRIPGMQVVAIADLSPAGADLSFLQFDWNGDGKVLDDPTGIAHFGIYKGSDAVVDVRERY